jgi:hypothetical protein
MPPPTPVTMTGFSPNASPFAIGGPEGWPGFVYQWIVEKDRRLIEFAKGAYTNRTKLSGRTHPPNPSAAQPIKKRPPPDGLFPIWSPAHPFYSPSARGYQIVTPNSVHARPTRGS